MNWETPDEIQEVSPTVLITRKKSEETVVVVDDTAFEEFIEQGLRCEQVLGIN